MILALLGHVMNERDIEYQVVTGKVEGKQDRGRQRQTFVGRTGVDIICFVENKKFHHEVTVNVKI